MATRIHQSAVTHYFIAHAGARRKHVERNNARLARGSPGERAAKRRPEKRRPQNCQDNLNNRRYGPINVNYGSGMSYEELLIEFIIVRDGKQDGCIRC